MGENIDFNNARKLIKGAEYLDFIGAPSWMIDQYENGNVLISKENCNIWNLSKQELQVVERMKQEKMHAYHLIETEGKIFALFFHENEMSNSQIKGTISADGITIVDNCAIFDIGCEAEKIRTESIYVLSTQCNIEILCTT